MERSEAKRLLEFIRSCPSVYHTVERLRAMLEQAGYARLRENAPWQLAPGGKYYVVRGGASIAAFRVPSRGAPARFRIAAAHSDSPAFKLKPNAELCGGGYVRVNTEPYGGMLMHGWLDRPLSVAGRVLVRTDEGVAARVADVGRDILVIPSLAVHMDRSANDGRKYLANVDTLPLLGGKDRAGGLHALIAEAAGVCEQDIVDADLFVYCREPGGLVGAEEDYILSPRLDDLECVWGCVRGFLDSAETPDIPVCCIFDNEEVGSATRQGAGSAFLRDTLRRVALALGSDEQAFQAMLADSFMVSADNAHAVHPNHPEYADSENCPRMNGGVVIKYNAARRYATDGVSAALFREVCRAADVPVQVYANRSDLPGGSTLGSIAETMLPVRTVDIGMAQLAMHSAVETAGSRDPELLVRAMTAYYAAELSLSEP
ncbi:MAG: M18 family aminopeptidase [Ruminococcaceae bacterium]|nr:M18 family aminopeptidase [Oscillospiraceae bacterium]